MKQLAKYESQAFALLRIMAGFMFSFHGAQKVLGVFAGCISAKTPRTFSLHLQRPDGSSLFPVPLAVPDGGSVLSDREQR